MNIKTKLILAATAVVLLSAPASARTNGDSSWASAFAYNTGGHVDHAVYPRYRVQHQYR